MRRRILLTLLASTSIVLVAFLVPLMVIIGSFAVDRAQREVVLQIQPLVSRIPVVAPESLAELVDAFAAETGHPATVYLADDTIVGAPRPLDPSVQLARDKGAFFAEADGGRDLLVPVYTDTGEAILRVFVTQEELTGAVREARADPPRARAGAAGRVGRPGAAACPHVPPPHQRAGCDRRAAGGRGPVRTRPAERHPGDRQRGHRPEPPGRPGRGTAGPRARGGGRPRPPAAHARGRPAPGRRLPARGGLDRSPARRRRPARPDGRRGDP